MIILTRVNRNNYYRHNSKKCIKFVNKYRNFIFDYYNYYEYKKFKDYFIQNYYCYYKLYKITYFNYSGKDHREDGPAYIKYNKNDEISKKEYYLNGEEYSYEEYLLEIKK